MEEFSNGNGIVEAVASEFSLRGYTEWTCLERQEVERTRTPPLSKWNSNRKPRVINIHQLFSAASVVNSRSPEIRETS